VCKKSAIDAPKGPPRLLISWDEFLLKKPESETSYETSDTNIYKEIVMVYAYNYNSY
jgi:hypothetical protein